MRNLLAMFAVMMLLPATALAESECEMDADCPEGSYCVQAPSVTCACLPCDPDDGGECPECNCPEPTDPEGFCEEIDLGFDNIVAGECASDADCPLDFLCQEVEIPCYNTPDCACACEPCPEDAPDCDDKCDCDCPEPVPCDEESKMMCVFTPTECVVDDDCVEGFECFAIEQCSGSGSMGSCVCENCLCADCPEGEECPPCNCPEEPVCECDDEPVPEFEEECTTLASICFPKEVSCETDADCAEDFTCVDIGMGDSGGTSSDCVCPPCACPPCPEGEECEDCDCQPCECDDADDDFEAEAELICMPNGWEDADYVGGEGDPDTSKAADESEEGAADGSTDDSSGCTASATANGMPAAMMFFLLLGLALVRTRKSYLS